MSTETWKRTNPDSAIFLPKGKEDGCNQQVNAVRTNSGAFVVVWTMAGEESSDDQRVVAARSTDNGKTWSEPVVIASQDTAGYLASYGIPFYVPRLDRIYVAYSQNRGQNSVRTDNTGVALYKYSEDDGQTWHEGGKLDMGRGEFSHPSPDADPNWIGIFAPIVTSKGTVLAGFGRYKAGPELHGGIPYSEWETEIFFERFDNILTEDDPTKLKVTILPQSPQGLRVKRTESAWWCNEPALIELSDGRLFAVLRTRSGSGYYAVSDDQAETWTTPKPLCYTNGGDEILNPNAPMILHRTAGGDVILLHYINEDEQGTFGLRDPIYLAIGHETLDKEQPVEFGESRLFMTVNNECPPEGTTAPECASYSSLFEDDGRLYLFYSDTKCYVLFKDVTDEISAAIAMHERGR